MTYLFRKQAKQSEGRKEAFSLWFLTSGFFVSNLQSHSDVCGRTEAFSCVAGFPNRGCKQSLQGVGEEGRILEQGNGREAGLSKFGFWGEELRKVRAFGSFQAVFLMLARSSEDVNAATENGETPLFAAAQ